MSEERGYSAGSVILAFVLGGIVGAGAALLTAPQSGKETREKLKELSDETIGKLKELSDETKKRAVEYAGHVKENLTSAVDNSKHFVEEKKSLISTAIEAGKEAYEKEKGKHSHS